MRRIVPLVLGMLVLLALSGGSAFAQEVTLTIGMMEENNSGQSGTATLTLSEDGTQITVEINISGGSDVPQPAHIHAGTCANLDPTPAIPLNPVVNGRSVTVIMEDSPTGMPSMESEEFAINVHKSAAEADVYVACGDISAENVVSVGGMPVGMPRTGAGDNMLPVAALAALMLIATGLRLSFARRRI